MFNGTERFLIEKIRINNKFDFMGMQLTQAEIISSLIFLTGIGLFFFFMISAKRKTA
jgi:phosphatidylglycerol:prolipoprotein diacylglycerol transferase